eukprot:402833_1
MLVRECPEQNNDLAVRHDNIDHGDRKVVDDQSLKTIPDATVDNGADSGLSGPVVLRHASKFFGKLRRASEKKSENAVEYSKSRTKKKMRRNTSGGSQPERSRVRSLRKRRYSSSRAETRHQQMERAHGHRAHGDRFDARRSVLRKTC